MLVYTNLQEGYAPLVSGYRGTFSVDLEKKQRSKIITRNDGHLISSHLQKALW